MGKRDSNGKRVKWTGEERRMVKTLKAQGLLPNRPVLELRGRAERLGKLPMINPPDSQDQPLSRIIPYEQIFYPIASAEEPSSSSWVRPRITPQVNSVIVVPDHNEHGEEGQKTNWESLPEETIVLDEMSDKVEEDP